MLHEAKCPTAPSKFQHEFLLLVLFAGSVGNIEPYT